MDLYIVICLFGRCISRPQQSREVWYYQVLTGTSLTFCSAGTLYYPLQFGNSFVYYSISNIRVGSVLITIISKGFWFLEIFSDVFTIWYSAHIHGIYPPPNRSTLTHALRACRPFVLYRCFRTLCYSMN